MKILNLTLAKGPFDVMATGEKRSEYRKPSPWILSRLLNHDGTGKYYDAIKFVNGYGHDKPFFICQYFGFIFHTGRTEHLEYSNGFKHVVEYGDVKIDCGPIIETGNLKP